MKKNRWIRALWSVLVIALLFGAWLLLSQGADNYRDKYSDVDLTTDIQGIGREDTYAAYLAAHKSAPLALSDIEVDVQAFEAEGEARVENDIETGKPGLYTGDSSAVTFHVNVPAEGLYQIRLDYLTVASRGVDVERALYLNGALPFSGADTLTFSRLWTDGGEVRKDNQGNDIRPTQAEVFDWQTAYCKDHMGYEVEPYLFYFAQGDNTLTLRAVNEPVILRGLTLVAKRENADYQTYLNGMPTVDMTDEGKSYLQAVQGESASLRSSPSLYARYDHSSSATVPYDVSRTTLNYIGGDPWNYPGQWIEWDFTVPEDGYYHITLKGRQNYQRGGLSCRSLYLDGAIPFAEMGVVTFFYQNAWNTMTLADANGEPYRFYMTKGDHKIRLEVTLGEMGDILQSMEESIFRLNQIYRKILVLTTVNPDKFRDYKLGVVYPDVIEAMSLESKRLYYLVDRAVATTGQKSDRVAVAQTMATQLESFSEDPDRITRAFVNFKDNITAMGTALQNMSATKLDIDCLFISGENAAIPTSTENFFTRMVHEARACIASFTTDYNMLGDVYDANDESVLEVWILTGRDQSTILKTMIDDSFTPQTGMKINLKLVDPNALLGAVVAGNGPDVVVSCDTWFPVNYALRNAAEDLRQFEDCETVLKQFYPSAYESMEFMGGVYGLPETQIYSLLFYRSDVLEELGVQVPQTWDELIALLPTIQGNNMSVGIPYPTTALPNINTLFSMLYQNGGTIYNHNDTRTQVDEEAGVKAFEDYTSLFTDYGLIKEFDFVSRFRSGEMPIGVADYNTYNTLVVSAPEIRGLWDFTLLPGTMRTDENGKMVNDRSVHSAGAGCMLIKTDDQRIREQGWEFMKWWVSTDMQVRFGREIESVLGSSARYATANVGALEQLAWSSAQLKVLKEQQTWAVGFREIAGGYYTARNITNAVRKVINEKVDPRETIIDYARKINEEIEKKRLEFGLPTE